MFMQWIAMAPPPGANGAQSHSSPMFTMGWLALMVAIFYFIMIRPQRRREKERKALISSIKAGDRVLLSSGILGDIANVKEKTLVVRIAEKTKIEVLKSAVSQVLEEKSDLPAEVKP